MVGIWLTIPGSPGPLAKNKAVIRRRGKKGPRFIYRPELHAHGLATLSRSRRSSGFETLARPAVVAIVAHWPTQWQEPDGRAPGNPRGDVDAVDSSVLDALAKAGLYADDAWVSVLLVANAYDKANPRIEVYVGDDVAAGIRAFEVMIE